MAVDRVDKFWKEKYEIFIKTKSFIFSSFPFSFFVG